NNAFADMGVSGYQTIDLEQVMAADERTAEEIDEERLAQVEETIAVGDSAA
ncbi:MAG: hypothetical protein JWM18_4901, partial [Chloroflexi bacterium]|nr:hypothetical protein [Chloroflexota bacterium]